MADDKIVKCPLCGAFSQIEDDQLYKALREPGIRQQVEQYVATLLKRSPEELASVGAAKSEPRNFQKDVHSWNPCIPIWRRSPKE